MLEKLDRRHSHSYYYSHRVWVSGLDDERRQDYAHIREWCWETFGAGCERDLVKRDNHYKYRWVFHCGQRNKDLYIYLKDELLTTFLLKWNVS